MTGLVPVEKQELAYSEAFKGAWATSPTKTSPSTGYRVERLEVAGPGDSWRMQLEGRKTVHLPPPSPQRDEKMGRGPRRRGASQNSWIQLVFPLGPPVGGRWGESVATRRRFRSEKPETAPGQAIRGAVRRARRGRGPGGIGTPRPSPRTPGGASTPRGR